MRFSKGSIWLSICLVSVLSWATITSVFSSPKAESERTVLPVQQMGVSGEVLVAYNEDASKTAKQKIKSQVGVEKTLKKIGPKGDKKIFLYKLKEKETVNTAVKRLRADTNVLYAEPNSRYQLSYTPNDPDLTKQWGLNNTGQDVVGTSGTPDADINAPEAWEVEQGFSNTVTVAVIDSGIDLNHPDLVGKLWENSGEIPDDGLDNDNNGYKDDVHGYNFAGISQYFYNTRYGIKTLPGYNHEFAQSIKGTGQPITSVDLGLVREGTPTTWIDVSVRDSLNGSDLSTATITAPDVSTTPAFTETVLTQPVQLDEGRTYYLVFNVKDNWVSTDTYSMFEYYDPYTDGNYREGMEHWRAGNDWLSFPEYDLVFKTNANASAHDDNGHGTHVSGIAAAATNNAIGIAGVAPGARIMPLKAGDSGGGLLLEDILDAGFYAVQNGADVINMSFGGAADSKLLDRIALDYAYAKGVVLVAAAGNSGPGAVSYPASFPNVISVGATTNKDLRAGFSNTNPFVDFAAPGDEIYSTMPTYPVALNSLGLSQNYSFMSGTSMASPMVAGVAALIRSYKPTMSPIGVEKAIEKGVADLGLQGRDDEYGLGRVDIAKTLDELTLGTNVVANPAQPNGSNGWYATTPTIGLEANLANANSFYAWDSTASVTTYTVDFQPPAEGTSTLYYYSQTQGETETMKNSEFKVDTGLPTDPTLLSSPSHVVGAKSNDNTIDISFSGATDTVSGISGYAVSWSIDASESPTGPTSLPASSTGLTSAPLVDGTWWFNLSTEDVAGNRTSTIHLGPFMVDSHAPTGTITINSGAAKANSVGVVLGLTASDGSGTGVDKMRFKNYGGAWSAWEGFNTSKAWTLTSTNGDKKVYVQFKDVAGNMSTTPHDEIILDTRAPTAKVKTPAVSTMQTKKLRFKVRWSGSDPSPGTGVKLYDVQRKVAGGSWINWRQNTSAKASYYKSRQGEVDYFRARAKDNAGNVGSWSRARRTVVPYDNNHYLRKKIGFNRTLKKSKSKFFQNSIRYSVTGGDVLIYRFSGKSVKLISTKAPSRSRAKIYINGRYIKTINTYSSKIKYRQVVFSAKWRTKKTRNLKIVNMGTPGRSLFDTDGLAITR